MDETTAGPDAGEHASGPAAPAVPAADGALTEAAEHVESTAGQTGQSGQQPRPPGAPKKRRRGSRGGRRRKPSVPGEPGTDDTDADFGDDDGSATDTDDSDDAERAASDPSGDAPAPARATAPRTRAPQAGARPRASSRPTAPATSSPNDVTDPELPESAREGRVNDPEAAAAALVPRAPKIGDVRPAPAAAPRTAAATSAAPDADRAPRRKKSKSSGQPAAPRAKTAAGSAPSRPASESDSAGGEGKSRKRSGRARKAPTRAPSEADLDLVERRRGKERKGRPVGRYLMCVQVRENVTQVAVLEGLSLIEHYVSRPADDVGQIHGNIYLGRVQNILPGMEAAFVDIATPKNAVLYRGDVQYDAEDIVERSDKLRIEQMLKARQLILCQITKNPIGAKGARLTQEVSLPGRFVVLIPNSKTFGISKRLPDDERKRLRSILDRVKPGEHGLIVRTAAEGATEHELRTDVLRLVATWQEIAEKAEKARKANQARLLYREPELAVRVIREEFNAEYRGIVIDDRRLFEEVKAYVEVMNPELADRVEFYDPEEEGLGIFERFHVHEQLHKSLDRKVWLPSGGSLIIEHTEALTVIDVNTGKNVGTSNLEETVFHNNLEAAEEIARQLRLRDIGGIIVIDFIDMEVRENRRKVVDSFRSALARDKTRTQVFDISDLGLVEMTRKRIGEGLLTNYAEHCPMCAGRGVLVDYAMLD